MIITFHGTGAGTGRLGRKTSCIEIESRGTRLLLDAGSCPNGEPKPLDGIVISHTHPDHICALPQILMDNWLWGYGRSAKTHIPEIDRDAIIAYLMSTMTGGFFAGINDGFAFDIQDFHIMPIANKHSERYMMGKKDGSFSFYVNTHLERLYYSADVADFQEILDHLASSFYYETAIIEGAHYDLRLLAKMPEILTDRMPKRVLLTHVWNPKNNPQRPFVEIPEFITVVNDGDIIDTEK